ncbi:hypothetical protein HID58_037874 [Brassica napus]|uniref:Mitochondrial import inner membrane translocase subunit TIM50 n=1 Tax=Brassica napus TaxID=3708 RepID=A0ABQ8BMP4_BRANA|nr:hypothetical protein HID58_037874 [Brassica napus]
MAIYLTAGAVEKLANGDVRSEIQMMPVLHVLKSTIVVVNRREPAVLWLTDGQGHEIRALLKGDLSLVKDKIVGSGSNIQLLQFTTGTTRVFPVQTFVSIIAANVILSSSDVIGQPHSQKKRTAKAVDLPQTSSKVQKTSTSESLDEDKFETRKEILDMDKCAKTEASCLDNKNKKVVFKDLSLIWKKGDYSKSNTVLLDDSPYKALLNPVTIFPYTYNHGNENDTSLGDDGDRRLYLKKLVEAENVQEFIQKNPFGQEAIKEGNKDWQFYKEIEINIGNNNDGVKDNNLNRALDDLEGRTASLL